MLPAAGVAVSLWVTEHELQSSKRSHLATELLEKAHGTCWCFECYTICYALGSNWVIIIGLCLRFTKWFEMIITIILILYYDKYNTCSALLCFVLFCSVGVVLRYYDVICVCFNRIDWFLAWDLTVQSHYGIMSLLRCYDEVIEG